MNNRANIKLYHIRNVDGLLELAGRSHGPVCLMDEERALCDLREEMPGAGILRALGHDGELPELHLSIPAEDISMFLDYMISNAA